MLIKANKVHQYDVQLYKLQLVREETVRYQFPIGEPASTTSLVAHIAAQLLENADREHFLVCCLDNGNRVIAIQTVSIGTINASLVSVREIFKTAILANATSIVCVHNHPSGNVQPSEADKKLTIKLVEAGNYLEIPVLDHVIVGFPVHAPTYDYFSFAERQLIGAHHVR
jgi:DNA repair protein RadC